MKLMFIIIYFEVQKNTFFCFMTESCLFSCKFTLTVFTVIIRLSMSNFNENNNMQINQNDSENLNIIY